MKIVFLSARASFAVPKPASYLRISWFDDLQHSYLPNILNIFGVYHWSFGFVRIFDGSKPHNFEWSNHRSTRFSGRAWQRQIVSLSRQGRGPAGLVTESWLLPPTSAGAISRVALVGIGWNFACRSKSKNEGQWSLWPEKIETILPWFLGIFPFWRSWKQLVWEKVQFSQNWKRS